MARILLVDAGAVVPQSPFLAQPVGLLSMAAVLQRLGHQVTIHDCKLDNRGLVRRLTELQPDVVGIRTVTVYLGVLDYVVRHVRQFAPQARIILGGPHATLHPHDALLRTGADAACLGEGEATVGELVEAVLEQPACSRKGLPRIADCGLRNGDCGSQSVTDHAEPPGKAGGLHEVAGIAWLDGGELRRSAPRPPIEDLDSLPMPAWELVPWELYFQKYRAGTAANGRSATVMTSRGCPYACAFCHNLFGRKFRTRSAEAVTEEFLYLHRRFGLEEVEVQDDAFNINRGRALDVALRMQRARCGLKLSFANGLRGDLLDRDLLVELRLAGTHHIALAPETASLRLQEMVGKRMDLDRLSAAAACCDELGIFTLGYFIIGFPGETEAEMQQTLEWAFASPFHAISVAVANPFPGTRLHQWAVEQGKLKADTEPEGYFETTVNISDIPDDRFVRAWHSAYRRFYLDPRRMWRLARSVPNLATLLRNSACILRRL